MSSPPIAPCKIPEWSLLCSDTQPRHAHVPVTDEAVTVGARLRLCRHAGVLVQSANSISCGSSIPDWVVLKTGGHSCQK